MFPVFAPLVMKECDLGAFFDMFVCKTGCVKMYTIIINNITI
jgi:hypothetical protein